MYTCLLEYRGSKFTQSMQLCTYGDMELTERDHMCCCQKVMDRPFVLSSPPAHS
jgi:hypothetical protein